MTAAGASVAVGAYGMCWGHFSERETVAGEGRQGNDSRAPMWSATNAVITVRRASVSQVANGYVALAAPKKAADKTETVTETLTTGHWVPKKMTGRAGRRIPIGGSEKMR